MEHAITDKKAFCLVSNSDNSQVADKDRIKIRNLYRNVTQIERETGRKETYFGFPFLQGHVNKDWYVRGPLILFPISISYKQEGRSPGWYVSFSPDKAPILNRPLLEALRKKGGYVLPDLQLFMDEFETFIEDFQQERGKSVTTDRNSNCECVYLNGLVNLLDKYKFPIDLKLDFNETQHLDPITDYNTEVSGLKGDTSISNNDIAEYEPLHLVNYKLIGNFPQGESSIYSDYDELLKKIDLGNEDQKTGELEIDNHLGILQKLLQDDTSSDDDPWLDTVDNPQDLRNVPRRINLDSVPSSELNLAIESDASQDNVVVTSSGDSDCTVVRGPPGTGKSQAIVNLISNSLSNNKKVLLVCQKRAALDVVFQRLDKIGLSSCVAFLHDPIVGRDSLYKRFANILESDSTSQNTTLINTKLNHYSQEIDNIIKQQNTIVSALQDQTLTGLPITKLYLLSTPGYNSKLDLSQIVNQIKYQELERVIEIVSNMSINNKKFDSRDSPWYYRKDFSSLSLSDKDRLHRIMDNIIALSNVDDCLLLGSEVEQNKFIDSLAVLESGKGKGMFGRLFSGVNRRVLQETVQGYLGQINFQADLEDVNNVRDLHRRARLATVIWDSLNELSNFVHEGSINNIVKDFLEDQRVRLQHARHEQETQRSADRLGRMKESLTEFYELQTYDRTKLTLKPLENEMLKICADKLSNEPKWDEILRQEFYLQWIDYIEGKNPSLRGKPFEAYMQNRQRLAKLLSQHRKIVVEKIISQINASVIRPDTTLKELKSYKVQYNPWSRLLDEVQRKRHVLPVRKLFEKYGSLIFKIAPCWLATPEAVSSIFPLQRKLFDLVIFDEASQSAVERSITALYRGSKVVVIGDEKQLRPFDLFKIKDEEDYEQQINLSQDEDRILFSESLLMLARRMFNYTYLTWHYRSTYQELMDFSNNAFYDGRLKVAANIWRKAVPIRWISCNEGSWVDRGNKAEAKIVVDQLKNILLKYKNGNGKQIPSIGIITFNNRQQTIILDEIDRRLLDDPEFHQLYSAADNPENRMLDDRPFVKNIENVQGDERDIIIFSVGYAATNPTVPIHITFGAINQLGGENRMNVAITRARLEIVIVCSFDPYRIKTDDAKNEGPKILKDYLCYAKAVSESNTDEVTNIISSLKSNSVHNIESTEYSNIDDVQNESGTAIVEHSLEQSVLERLQKLGYQVDTHVGNSNYKVDLAVVHPDFGSKYILAIEFDGPSFLSAAGTRERDITRPKFLERNCWTVEQIWSKNWWLDSNKEIDRIQQKIEDLRKITSQPEDFPTHGQNFISIQPTFL